VTWSAPAVWRRVLRRRCSPGLIALSALAVAALLSGCSAPSRPHAAVVHRPLGGTATVAYVTGTGPNWIFPFAGVAQYSVANYQDFIDLMYRPLYVFGGNSDSTSVNYPLSPAEPPQYTDGGRTVSITLKDWSWSDGEKVDAQDVVFWLNMDEAEKAIFFGYTKGGIPDNLVSYRAIGPRTVELRLTRPYASDWFTDNELAQITPMPLAWDVTKAGALPGSGGCVRDSAADHWAKCKAVYAYLTAESRNVRSYAAASSPWSVVDGPWRLSAYRIGGDATFAPNRRYSGPVKPALADFRFVSYDSEAAIFEALRDGRVDMAAVPEANLPPKPAGEALPAVSPLGKNYYLQPAYTFGINYFTVDFQDRPDAAMFRQLYFRQALQELTNQDAIASKIDRGYATPTAGGVPSEPSSPWVSAVMTDNHGAGPYPYDPGKAKALLAAHGWTDLRGTLTCERPGTGEDECGASIIKGERADLGLAADWSDTPYMAATMKAVGAGLGAAGIHIMPRFPVTLLGPAPCAAAQCTTAMIYLGDWTFNGPGYEPSGELLFQTGAAWNYGLYSSPQMDTLIRSVQDNASLTVFHDYASYTATQLPVIWLPVPYYVVAVRTKLRGVTQSPLGSLYPEYWYLEKR
jgi:peptide/nickel transport system substrate-binding protein